MMYKKIAYTRVDNLCRTKHVCAIILCTCKMHIERATEKTEYFFFVEGARVSQ